MTTTIISLPFANAGTKTPIDDTRTDGIVNMTQGYTDDYSRELGVDTAAKAVERDKLNWLLNLITSNLQDWQLWAFPQWLAAADYAPPAIVRYTSNSTVAEKIYRCLVDPPSGTVPTNTTYWEEVISITSLRSLIPMPFQTQVTSSTDFNTFVSNGTWVFDTASIVTGSANSPSGADVGVLEVRLTGTTALMQRYTDIAGKIFVRGRSSSSVWSSWTSTSISYPVSVVNGGTGASTAEDALANLGAASAAVVAAAGIGNVQSTRITNLNVPYSNSKVPMFWSAASTATNAPVAIDTAGVWAQFADGSGFQLGGSVINGTNRMFFRGVNATGSTWNEVAALDKVQTFSVAQTFNASVTINASLTVAGNVTTSGSSNTFLSGSGTFRALTGTARLASGQSAGAVVLRPDGESSESYQCVASSVGFQTVTGFYYGGDTSHYIDVGTSGVNRMILGSYSGLYQFRNTQTGVDTVTISGGQVSATGGFNYTSSRKVKDFLGDSPYGADELERLSAHIGRFKKEFNDDGNLRIFLDAEQVESVMPELVYRGPGCAKFNGEFVPHLNADQFTAVLVKASGENSRKIRELEALVAQLIEKLDGLKE